MGALSANSVRARRRRVGRTRVGSALDAGGSVRTVLTDRSTRGGGGSAGLGWLAITSSRSWMRLRIGSGAIRNSSQ